MKTAMILAAGRGARMRHLTETTPKPLLLVAGKPLIEHHILKFAAAGFERIVINLGWLGEQIPSQIGDGSRFGVEIVYSDETHIPGALETAGGIINALPLLGSEPFAVVSADIWSEYDYAKLGLADEMLCHLVMVPAPSFHPQGDFALEDGVIKLKQQESQQGYCFANFSVYRPEFFTGWAAGRRPLREPWDKTIPTGKVSGELYSGTWFNVGNPEQLDEINQFVTS